MTQSDTFPRPNSINWLLKLVTFGAMLMALIFPAWGKIGNKVEMEIRDGKRCFMANGIPDHPTGKFTNRGNPNAIKAQQISVCVPLEPIKSKVSTPIKGTMGIAINGVQFRPNTAGFWDPSARRGHSRQGNPNWSLDIFGAPGKLGLDFNNGHVGHGGLYHYHGIARDLIKNVDSSLVGYAGDGFEIHLGENKEANHKKIKANHFAVTVNNLEIFMEYLKSNDIYFESWDGNELQYNIRPHEMHFKFI